MSTSLSDTVGAVTASLTLGISHGTEMQYIQGKLHEDLHAKLERKQPLFHRTEASRYIPVEIEDAHNDL